MDSDENCALNEDGTLKDAREITFYNSPSDSVPLSLASRLSTTRGAHAVPDSPTLMIIGRAKQNSNQQRLQEAIEEELRPLTPRKNWKDPEPAQARKDNVSRKRKANTNQNTSKSVLTLKDYNITTSSTKRPQSNGGSDSDIPAKRARVLKKPNTAAKSLIGSSERVDDPPNASIGELDASNTSLNTSAGEEAPSNQAVLPEGRVNDVAAPIHEEKPEEKSEVDSEHSGRGGNALAVADILTFATRLDNGGFRCDVCVKLRNEGFKKYPIKQIIFANSTTSMRCHCARFADTHLSKYLKGCKERGIKPHKACLSIVEDTENSNESMRQSSIEDYATTATTKTVWSKEGLIDRLLRYIINNNQPISVVDDDDFRDLLLYQRGPSAKETDIPHHTKMSQLIEDRADEVEADLKQIFKELPPGRRVSFTFDGWTSANMTPFVAMTAHYVSNDWELCRNLLSFAELSGSHNAKNLAKHFYATLREFGLIHRLLNLTGDNVSTNDVVMKELQNLLVKYENLEENFWFNYKQQRSHCYAHIVALAERAFLTSLAPKTKANSKNANAPADEPDMDFSDEAEVDNKPETNQTMDVEEELEQDESEETEEEILQMIDELESPVAPSREEKDLKELKTLLLNVRGFVAKQRRLPLAKHYFCECCRTVNIEERELLPFCATRWSSMLTVIERLLLVEMAVKYFMNTADDCNELPKPPKGQWTFGDYKFSTRQWDLLVIVRDVLLEASKVQQAFSSEKDPSVYKVLPVFDEFREKWESMTEDPRNTSVRPAIAAGIKLIDKYYEKAKISEANVISIYLMPDVKDAYFTGLWLPSEHAKAQAVLEKVYDRYSVYRPKSSGQSGDMSNEASKGLQMSVRSSFGGNRLQASILQRRMQDQQSPMDEHEEICRYLKDPLVGSEDCANVFKWWKENAARYPVLSIMAANYLAVQGSSVPCECQFSSAGLVDTKRRNRLAAKKFGSIEFLKSYYKQQF